MGLDKSDCIDVGGKMERAHDSEGGEEEGYYLIFTLARLFYLPLPRFAAFYCILLRGRARSVRHRPNSLGSWHLWKTA